MVKKRLDILVSEKIGVTRTKAQALIMAGQVFVDGVRIEKSGTEVEESKNIKIKDLFPYVSRGALKLEKAALEFKINFNDKVVCDIGASTGGFTDYALQNGAEKVYAIDVGYGQLAQKIRENKRVVVMERTNIKDVNSLPEPINIFLLDVSFISLKKVLPQVLKINENHKLNNEDYSIITLVKPQFEVGKKVADRFRGVINDPQIQKEVFAEIKNFAAKMGFKVLGEVESPIKGAKGNTEFLLHLKISSQDKPRKSK